MCPWVCYSLPGASLFKNMQITQASNPLRLRETQGSSKSVDITSMVSYHSPSGWCPWPWNGLSACFTLEAMWTGAWLRSWRSISAQKGTWSSVPARTAHQDPGPCVTRSPLVFLDLQVPNRLLSLALLPPHLCTGLHSDFPPQGRLPASPSLPPTRKYAHPFTSEQLPTPSLCYTQHLKVSLSRRSHSRMEFPFVPIKAQLNAFFFPLQKALATTNQFEFPFLAAQRIGRSFEITILL